MPSILSLRLSYQLPMNKIIFSAETPLPIKPDRNMLRKIANRCFRNEDISVPCQVSVIFCDNQFIQEVNREQRGIDSPTDVLSFPNTDSINGQLVYDSYDMEDGYLYLGDIIISIERAIAQANEYGHGVDREIGFLLSHGIYHIMGYDHVDGSNIMFEKQEQVLMELGLRR